MAKKAAKKKTAKKKVAKKAVVEPKPEKAVKQTQVGLNAKQKQFCQLFAKSEEFFGNGVQSYIEAYDIDIAKPGQYSAAGAGASRLLKSVKILTYIDKIMEKVGFNAAHADKQLGFLMTQNAELGVKLGAIRHFNDLRQRITQKIELSGEVTLKPPVIE